MRGERLSVFYHLAPVCFFQRRKSTGINKAVPVQSVDEARIEVVTSSDGADSLDFLCRVTDVHPWRKEVKRLVSVCADETLAVWTDMILVNHFHVIAAI